MSTRVAAFDCGTNSLRLLVADVVDGQVHDVVRRMEVVRLGEGVDRTGEIAPEAMSRTLEVLREYAAACTELGVDTDAIRFVATSASRDARNAAVFIDGVCAILGVEPEVISGTEEAELSFVGATSGLEIASAAPFLVVDLGGGSTELVLGGAGVEAAYSMDVGCVRITERHLADDPPSRAQIAAARADIDAALDLALAEVPLARTRTLVGLAGSVTTITAHALGLAVYDATTIHGTVLSVNEAISACDDLLAMSRSARADLGFMHPGRVDVIGAGALVWSRVVSRVVDVAGISEVIASEHDILDGVALELAARSIRRAR